MKRFIRPNNTWMDMRDILKSGEPFTNSTKAFRGVSGLWFWGDVVSMSVGHMDEAERQIMISHADRNDIDYIVWSYQTPVAWRDGLGNWFVTTRNYSKTTAKQLGPLRTAIQELRKEKLAA